MPDLLDQLLVIVDEKLEVPRLGDYWVYLANPGHPAHKFQLAQPADLRALADLLESQYDILEGGA